MFSNLLFPLLPLLSIRCLLLCPHFAPRRGTAVRTSSSPSASLSFFDLPTTLSLPIYNRFFRHVIAFRALQTCRAIIFSTNTFLLHACCLAFFGSRDAAPPFPHLLLLPPSCHFCSFHYLVVFFSCLSTRRLLFCARAPPPLLVVSALSFSLHCVLRVLQPSSARTLLFGVLGSIVKQFHSDLPAAAHILTARSRA